MNNRTNFIYVGRLVEEKGFDLLLELFSRIAQDENLQQTIHIDVFGDGPLKNQLQTGVQQRSFVNYHGHQPKEQVKKIRKKAHRTLIPSRFLETFGLTALDSLMLGVPIIAPNKGGLNQFMENLLPYNIDTGEKLYVHIKHLITTYNEQTWQVLSGDAKKRAHCYRKQQRCEQFQAYAGLETGAKILLISDYIVDVGGIENYVLNVKDLLMGMGYEVKIIGCDDQTKARSRFWQLFGTIRNTTAQKLIVQTLESFQPDLIRRHSIQRRWGPLPLRSAKPYAGKQWVMYHDFGLFHPYPSGVVDEEQVTSSITFSGYIREGIKKKRWQLPLHIAKRCSSLLIKTYLARIIDLHLVPSPYMEELVQNHYDKNIHITTLSHFH